ncbi:MAG: thiamine biosynthesis protein ThiF [Ruminococcus sp.]|nr:thiamine biosynthesis protein ThiF [Ruminococcus sp.]
MGIERQKRFAESTVAVCGLGGLGSNIAVALARAGIGKLILSDFDKVDISNLSRQQYKANQTGIFKTDALCENLREISPYTEIETHCVRLCEDNYSGILKNAGIICEAFDKAEEKSRLVNFVLEHMPEKIIVAASGMAGLGAPDDIRTRQIAGNFYLCGDGKSDMKDDALYAPRVALCAMHQALTVLRILDSSGDTVPRIH